jgi:GWxTD domain-containing protein
MGCLVTQHASGRGRGVLLSLLLVALCWAPTGAYAQAAYQPEFDVDAVSVRGDRAAETRVDVYTKVPYRSLRFLSQDAGFGARYSVSANVYRTDAEGKVQGLVRSRMWEREVDAPTYDATQADTLFDYATQSLQLAPGSYALEVQVEDAASNRTFTRETPLTVRAFDRAVAMSDLLIADRYDSDAQVLFPNVSNAVGTNLDEFTLFYEIYAERPQTLRVRYEVLAQNRERRKPAVLRPLLGLPPREEDAPDPNFRTTETLEVRAGRNPATLTLDTERFGTGEYVFNVQLENASGTVVAEASKDFTVRWMGLNDQIADLESAVAQLRYIAKDREINAIRRADTPQEQFRLFQQFWDKRDPTPGTRRNERMEEYYFRVSFANRNYGRFTNNGWNTDRGEVFIRFGEPDFVERHPFSYGDKPYQIWYYSRIGRRFIFVDETGFGDFELLVPIWDERTRM